MTWAFFFALGCVMLAIVALAIVTLVIVLIVKNRSKQGSVRPDHLPGGGDGPGRHHVQVQHAADGFWLHAPRVSPGSLIRYRYWSGGTMRTGSVAASHGPKGAFVYTGTVPSQVEVLDVLPAAQALPPDDDFAPDGGGSFASPSTPPQDTPGVPPAVAASEPFTGPPPAY